MPAAGVEKPEAFEAVDEADEQHGPDGGKRGFYFAEGEAEPEGAGDGGGVCRVEQDGGGLERSEMSAVGDATGSNGVRSRTRRARRRV